MQTLQIQLLGDFRLLYNDEPVNMAHLARQQSLLAYLVLHRSAPQARRQLSFLFWPDASEAQARANLRKALYDLRKVMPMLDHFVEIDTQYLRWRKATNTILDIELFAASLAQAAQSKQPEVVVTALEEAVALYRGELLPTCYDEWLLRAREELRQKFVTALEQLVSLLEEQRKVSSALTYAQRLLHGDPLHESAYRLLMRLHVLNGDRASALRVYHSCVSLLQQELGVDPAPETQQLYQRLLQVPPTPAVLAKPPARASKGQLSLVGRQPEWQTLQSAWHAASTGTAHCVLIAGEAGIGKTRLAEEVLHWVEQQSYATARTRAYAAEGRLAYAPITEWLRSPAIRARLAELEPVWLVEVARLLPELLVHRPELPQPAPLADSWQRQHFREALVRALLLSRQPLLLVIDDLQWCDKETLEWLHSLLRLAAQEPLLVVGAMRSEEAEGNPSLTTLLTNLRHADQLTEIELSCLSSVETAALAGQIMGVALSHEQSAYLYTLTEGHPLFVVETLRAKGGKGALSERGEISASVSLPPKVQAVIRSRLAQLSPPAQALAALAATVGRLFSLDVLTRASEDEEETLVRALDELWQRRLIREQGERSYDFSHDRIREAAYSGVSSARRRLLHRRVAQALEQTYATDLDTISGEIASHYDQAGLPAQALPFYRRAARVAQRIYAHAEADFYLVRGLGLLEQLPITPDRLQQELEMCLSRGISLAVLKGISTSEAKKSYERAYELAVQVGDHADSSAALHGLFTSHMTQGHLRAAYDFAKERLALAEQVGDPAQRAEACGSLGSLLFQFGEWQASRSFIEQAVDRSAGRSFPSKSQVSSHHYGLIDQRNLAMVLWHLGYPEQAQVHVDEAITRAHKLSHPYTWAGVHSGAAWFYLYRREPLIVLMHAERAIALSLEHGFPSWLHLGTILKGWVLAQQGQGEAGIEHISRGIAARRAMGTLQMQGLLLAWLAEAHGQADQPTEGVRVLNEALAWVEASGEHCHEAEIYRLKGEFLRRQGTETREVEAQFRHALSIARRQEAKSPELRAAMSLCRLWQVEGRRVEAHALLAGSYGWFTEGFSTPDLIEAGALLAEVS